MKYALVASENRAAVEGIRTSLKSRYQVECARSRFQLMDMFRSRRYDFVFVDLEFLQIPGTKSDYKKIFQPFWDVYPAVTLVILVPSDLIREAVTAVKAGASNYLTYPINPDEVSYVVESIYQSLLVCSELDYLRDQFWDSDALEMVQTRSPLMRTVFNKIKSVAPTRSTVLLSGETGTGKGIMAKLIHRHSRRQNAPFISVHCGAIPDTLLESELFGHEKGAFTGAVRRKMGRFEVAKGGTIFLDEIGTITPSAQIKLLQILQDSIFQRLGGEQCLEADVRVISATNTDLKSMCDQGRFRRDLYYRLNVFPVEIPPLRDRREDVPLFVGLFLKKLNRFYPKQIYGCEQSVMEALTRYSWPGNIRELENLIERAFILESSSLLSPSSFPADIIEPAGQRAAFQLDTRISLSEARRKAVEHIEQQYLKELLTRNLGKINDSAAAAGVTTRQLNKLMKRYGIQKELFKKNR